jgi:uncharacterized protein (UPF0264 family)
MSKLLASVKNVEEALIALRLKVDIIDLKAPEFGALGALNLTIIQDIVQSLQGQSLISATIGDLPMQSTLIAEHITNMAKTNVDYIKIGFFPCDRWLDICDHLKIVSDKNALIAVLFADTQPGFDIIPQLKIAGFKGVMLDTMDKGKGSLMQVMPIEQMKTFVQTAKDNALICGLAGSLRIKDVPYLQRLNADYLGFRGALCHQHQRTAELDPSALAHLRTLVTD